LHKPPLGRTTEGTFEALSTLSPSPITEPTDVREKAATDSSCSPLLRAVMRLGCVALGSACLESGEAASACRDADSIKDTAASARH